MKRLDCLFLDRSTPKEGQKTILTAIDYIKQGISICILPEGTRNPGEELSMLPFHSGSFKIDVYKRQLPEPLTERYCSPESN